MSSPVLRVSLDRPPANKERAVRPAKVERWISETVNGPPALHGRPIHVQFLPALTAHRGKLLSGDSERGSPIHAASFLRERRIVLESVLMESEPDLKLILAHELYHFVWWRLGNARRREYDQLLRAERIASARGELGESSAVAKRALGLETRVAQGAVWKNYVCESFCDTGAWFSAAVNEHRGFQLARKWRDRRAAWLGAISALGA